ncbi:hypothetical protein ACFLX5_03810 [Chloroflexota bacterium]
MTRICHVVINPSNKAKAYSGYLLKAAAFENAKTDLAVGFITI